MAYLKQYLKTIEDRGNKDLAESIAKTASDIGDKYISNFSFCEHETGLLFGNVQSGKTAQMFGVISEATDKGFSVFVLLTTDNVVLQQQTLERVVSDLQGYCVCGETDGTLFLENALIKPVIIVLKKNVRVLKLWANILNSTGFMKGNPLFIIDDEADAASLNTLVNKEQQSSINRYLTLIKNEAGSSLYLQVTGTPQALLLQSAISGWRPYFTYYFEPGRSYLGGDFFFPAGEIPRCINFLDLLANPIREMLVHHLVVSAQVHLTGGTVSNCLVHPSVRQNAHEKFALELSKELKWCEDNIDVELVGLIEKEYNKLEPVKSLKLEFDKICTEIKRIIQEKLVKVLIMNGKYDIVADDYSSGTNIVIGGNTLGRGVTFPSLHTIFYTRTSKKPQADTMWQHSRMFGYDRDSGMMMVYIDSKLYKLFADINASNNTIIAQVQKGIENIRVSYPKGIKPTRDNVLDSKKVSVITGGTNYYPFAPDNKDIENIDKLLSVFDDKERYYQVSLRLILNVFDYIEVEEEFELEAFKNIIKMILAENPREQAMLIVRRNRDVAKGTGALLSPNDWELGASFKENVVLTMYKMTGNKGWNGKKIWVPNIKLPDNNVYYDVKD